MVGRWCLLAVSMSLDRLELSKCLPRGLRLRQASHEVRAWVQKLCIDILRPKPQQVSGTAFHGECVSIQTKIAVKRQVRAHLWVLRCWETNEIGYYIRGPRFSRGRASCQAIISICAEKSMLVLSGMKPLVGQLHLQSQSRADV